MYGLLKKDNKPAGYRALCMLFVKRESTHLPQGMRNYQCAEPLGKGTRMADFEKYFSKSAKMCGEIGRPTGEWGGPQ
jgi:hypothetical protein